MKQGTLFLIVILGFICHLLLVSACWPGCILLRRQWGWLVGSMEASGSLWVSLHCQRRSNRRAIQSLPGRHIVLLDRGLLPESIVEQKASCRIGVRDATCFVWPKTTQGKREKTYAASLQGQDRRAEDDLVYAQARLRKAPCRKRVCQGLRSAPLYCYDRTTSLTQIHRTASFPFFSSNPYTVAHVR